MFKLPIFLLVISSLFFSPLVVSEILFTKEYPAGIERDELEAIERAAIEAEDRARHEAELKKLAVIEAAEKAKYEAAEREAEAERARKDAMSQKSNVWLPKKYKKLMPKLELAAQAARKTENCKRVLQATYRYQVSTVEDPLFSVLCQANKGRSFNLFYGGAGQQVRAPER